MDEDQIYMQVFENNRKWVESKLNQDEGFFQKLAREQKPDFLFIGCSDSRVPANEIMGLEPGEVFVHRNIANLVVNTDLNCHSVIQYAVETLQVKHVIVCGHYNCGGVRAAMEPKDLGLINNWLREIRDVYRMYFGELELLKDPVERYNRLVELNVQEQCINVIKTSFVQKEFIKTGYPRVHGWVYDLHNGLLKDLEVNFEETLSNIQRVYDLH